MEWHHQVSVPVVWAFEGFIRGNIGLDSRSVQQVDCILNLWGKLIPQLNREVDIRGAKGAYESDLDCLDGVLRGVNAVIVWLHKLEGTSCGLR